MSWGRVRLDISGTYFTRNDQQNLDGTFTGFVSNNFKGVVAGIVPRWKHYAVASWDSGPWAASLAQSYQSGYTDVRSLTPAPVDTTRRVSSMSLFDLQGSYTGFKNLTLAVGAKNVFDTNPPATNSNLTFQQGYDTNYYDARARFIYGSVRYAFK